jgi:hypothetical protein
MLLLKMPLLWPRTPRALACHGKALLMAVASAMRTKVLCVVLVLLWGSNPASSEIHNRRLSCVQLWPYLKAACTGCDTKVFCALACITAPRVSAASNPSCVGIQQRLRTLAQRTKLERLGS